MNLRNEESFLKDVATHTCTIIRDDGVHRHIRLARPGSSCMHFDLITWPGYLCYTGDMGTYVFCRLRDMFEFFRTDEVYADKKQRQLNINPNYWGQKLEGIDKGDGFRQFSPEKFERVVNEYRLRIVREMKAEGVAKSQRREFWESVESEVLDSKNDGEVRAYDAATGFEFQGYEFADFWEHDCTEYTHRFIWCCYALTWGIQQYDDAKEKAKGQEAYYGQFPVAGKAL